MKKTNKNLGRLMTFLIGMTMCIAVLALLPTASAATITVGPSGDHLTIQAAINAANPGDTILVAAGTYTEYLHIVKDDLTIQGAGIDQSIIDLDGLTPYWHYSGSSSYASRGGVLITPYGQTIAGGNMAGGDSELIEDVLFEGFTVKNAGVNPPLYVTGSHDGANNVATLSDSTASWTPGALVGYWIHNMDDPESDDDGIHAYGQITANTATTITASLGSGDENDWDTGDKYIVTTWEGFYDLADDGQNDVAGIKVGSGKNVVIQNCKVIDSGDKGITFTRARLTDAGSRPPSEDPVIMNCISSSNHDHGISVGKSIGSATITDNTVSDNFNPALPDAHVKGILVFGRSNSLTLGGTISNNIVSGNQYYGIEVYRWTDGFTIENNAVTGHNLHYDASGIFLSTGWGFSNQCLNHVVKNNEVTGNIRGIIAYFAWDCTIENNTITTDSGTYDPGQAAIKIDHAYNIEIKENDVSCDGLGIELTSGDTYDCTVTDNNVDGAMFAGIYLRSGAFDNTFMYNTIKNTVSDTFTQIADYGDHDGGDDQSTLSDSTKSWTTDEFVGMKIINHDDGSEGTISGNTATTVTATLSGGAENDWDDDDYYWITYDETQADGIFLLGGDVYSGGEAGTGNIFNCNNIYDNADDGMENQVSSITVDAENNWWGAVDGPSGLGPGTGDAVSTSVDYDPWLTHPLVKNLDTEEYFCSIQDAIDDSDTLPGHTIEVYDGTYDEIVIIDKQDLTVQAASSPIIQPTTAGSWPNVGAVNIVADGVTFTGFEVDASLGPAVGVNAYGVSDVTISNNIVHGADHTLDAVGIIAWDWTSASTVDDILIENNEVYDTGRMGIFCMDYDTDNSEYDLTEGHIIRGNTVYNTWTNTFGDAGGAIQINAGKDCEISDNLVYDTQNGNRGIYLFGSGSGNTITNNIIRDNPLGIQLWIDAVGGSPIDWEGDTATSPDVSCNSIYDNTDYGAVCSGSIVMDAECNWWGDASGPSGQGPGTGDAVSTNVDFDPWVGQVTADVSGPYVDDDCDLTIDFTGASYFPCSCGFSSVVGYEWEFGDGNTSSEQNPTHTYAAPGEYTVTLTVVAEVMGQTCSDSVSATATVYGVIANAGGPYDGSSITTVDFDASLSSGYEPPLMFDWDFGDGTGWHLDLGPTPSYTYAKAGDYTVTVRVTESHGCVDTDTAEVFIGNDIPLIQLYSPEDGDNVNGVVTVEWYAIDDDYPGGQGIPIYLYYKPSSAGSDAWRQINDVLTNNVDEEHGSYEWDTSSFADGEYNLIAEALDNEGNIAHDSIMINIGNGNSGVMLSDVFVEDTSIDSSHYVKDGDTVVVSAGITGNGDLTANDITADLSGFGLGSQTTADSFDGFTATWTLENVVCHPSDGTISVTVSVLDMSKTATITADNTAPEVTVDKPTSGFWFYNSRLLPMANTFILGPIEVQVSGSSDISRVEFFVDDELMYTDTEANFEWYMNQKLRGVHTLTVTVYDLAGNPTTTSQQVRVFNLFGEN